MVILQLFGYDMLFKHAQLRFDIEWKVTQGNKDLIYVKVTVLVCDFPSAIMLN
jgi:hypothetical protein